jgi:hypothetical protein
MVCIQDSTLFSLNPFVWDLEPVDFEKNIQRFVFENSYKIVCNISHKIMYKISHKILYKIYTKLVWYRQNVTQNLCAKIECVHMCTYL